MPNLPTAWQPLLDQVRDLHARCLHPADLGHAPFLAMARCWQRCA